MNYKLRPIELCELNMIFDKMKEDFPPNERAPFSAIRAHMKRKNYEGFILQKDGNDVAYCINSSSMDCEYTLISYLAVYKEFCYQGIGSAFIDELKRLYADKQGLIVEVEPPSNMEAQKRIEFYKKAGFILLDGISYKIFSIKMELMFWSGTQTEEYMRENIAHIIKSIYYRTLPKFLHGQVKI